MNQNPKTKLYEGCIMIRELKETDIGQIADIWLDTNIKAHDFIPTQYWRGNFDAVKEMFKQAEIYVYEDRKKIQGFIGLNKEYIEGIFVTAKAQSQGIGKLLLDFVKKRKKELHLSVYQKNTRAVQFYQREQFVIQSENIDDNTNQKEYVMIWRK